MITKLIKQKLGRRGLPIVAFNGSPSIELVEFFMCAENFLYSLADYKLKTENFLYMMSEKYKECYKLYSKTANIPVILIHEDASITLYSPKIFDKYLKPVLKEYCKIIKEEGKIAVIHACSNLRGLTKSLSETGIDCIESVSPPPTGNITISKFKKAMPDFCVRSGISANVFSLVEDFKKYVEKLILENKEGGNFIFE